MANKLNLPSYESLLQSGEQARDNGIEKTRSPFERRNGTENE